MVGSLAAVVGFVAVLVEPVAPGLGAAVVEDVISAGLVVVFADCVVVVVVDAAADADLNVVVLVAEASLVVDGSVVVAAGLVVGSGLAAVGSDFVVCAVEEVSTGAVLSSLPISVDSTFMSGSSP